MPENWSLVFTSSAKREKKAFLDVGVQGWLRNVQKSVMHVKSCCFANLNLLIFCRLRCLNSLISLMVKTEKRANKVPISTKKYCYPHSLKGMWVDRLCQRSPVEIQRYITNLKRNIATHRPLNLPEGNVSRLPLPEITGWNTNTHYKLNLEILNTFLFVGVDSGVAAGLRSGKVASLFKTWAVSWRPGQKQQTAKLDGRKK